MKRHGNLKYFAKAVEVGGVLYLSGMTADDRTQGMRGQTAQVLEKLRSRLAEMGSDMSKVVMATNYITDMSLKDEMNEAWLEAFAEGELPARATIGVADLGQDILIEIVFQAAV